MQASSIDRFFGLKLVINLERRRDRWQGMQDRLQTVGLSAERFLATDGSAAEFQAEYERYTGTPRQSVSFWRRIRTRPGFVFSRDHQARLAYLDHRRKTRAAATAGAWACLHSMRRALHHALDSGQSTCLLLEDDCVFHHDANEIFAEVIQQVPHDWYILQLGTMQWHWWYIRPYSENLYCNRGLSIGAHAVGYSQQAIEDALELLEWGDATYDEGVLSTLTGLHPTRSFVIRPNLAVQAGDDSDIGSSAHTSRKRMARRWRRFRWRPEDYSV